MNFTIFRRLLASITIILVSGSIGVASTISQPPLLISEIKPSGGNGKTTDEYVELYNHDSKVIDISGWKIAKLTKIAQAKDYTYLVPVIPSNTFVGPHGHFLVAHHDYAGSVEPDLRYDGISLADDNSVVLLDSNDVVVDLVGYGSALNFETASAPSPTTQYLSVERLPGAEAGNGQDTNSNVADFVRAFPTPQNRFSTSTPFIPLVPVGDELVLDQPETVLNNQENTVTTTVGSVSTSTILEISDLPTSTPESEMENQPVSSTPLLIVSSTPVVTEIISTNTNNSVVNHIEAITNPGDVLISEVVSAPTANEEEFVELYNRTTEVISLDAWWLEDGGGAKTILNGVIPSHGRFVVSKPKGSLNNDGDQIILGSRDGVIDQMTYGIWDNENSIDNAPAPKSGESLTRLNEVDTNNDKIDFTVTDQITRGSANRAPEIINQIDQAVNQEIHQSTTSSIRLKISGVHKVVVGESVTLDAGASSGGSGDLIFQWDFGDGGQSEGEYVEHVYKQEGSYRVILMVRDEQNSVKKKTWAIRVVPSPPKEEDKKETYQKQSNNQFIKDNLVISEMYPTPSAGEVEFIELFNSSSTTISLSGLQIDNDDSGSKPFIVPDDLKILAKHYRVFTRYETGLILRPTDQVRILDQNHNELLVKSYDDAPTGWSFNFVGDEWQWSQKLTPGKVNEIEEADEGILKVQGETPVKVALKKISKTAEKDSPRQKQAGFITMAAVDGVKSGNLVTLMGVVAAPPNSYATREFYLISESNEKTVLSTRNGVRVQYKKDPPPVLLGDAVTVTGEILEKSGERYIVVDSPDFVVVRSHGEVVVAESRSIQDALKMRGGLLSLQGTITEAKKQYWYIDDGTGEIQIALPKKSGQASLGGVAKVTGVLTYQNSDAILRLRDAGDTQVVTTSTSNNMVPVKNISQKKWVFIISCFGGIGIFFGVKKLRKYFAKKDLVTTPV